MMNGNSSNDVGNATGEEPLQKVLWGSEDPYVWDGDEYEIILRISRPNLIFLFGVPLTHNNIPPSEVGILQIYRIENRRIATVIFDRSELIDFQLGAALLVDQVFREPDEVESRARNSGNAA